MNIVVLCGGLSSERDVSLTSGGLVAKALRNRGHRAVLLDVFMGYSGTYDSPKEVFERPYNDDVGMISESVPNVKALFAKRGTGTDRIGEKVLEICKAADVVFMALHGEDGENGKLQALFDSYNIKYTGTGYLGSALAMNKGVAKAIFRDAGINTPKGVTILASDTNPKAPCFPCVVKPRSGGSSVGTSVVYDPADFDAALKLAFAYENAVIVEEFIKGRECDVGVLAGKALPVIEICPKQGFYDYKNKYQSGMTDEYCPADLPADVTEKLQRMAEAVYEALLMEVYGRMDFIVSENGSVYCLEANTLPGMTPMSLMPQEAAAIGMSYEDLCETIIHESLKKYQ